MKHIIGVALLTMGLYACDYSVKSNGNIDEAFSHEPIAEPKEMPHTELEKPSEATPTVIDTTTAIVADSTAATEASHQH